MSLFALSAWGFGGASCLRPAALGLAAALALGAGGAAAAVVSDCAAYSPLSSSVTCTLDELANHGKFVFVNEVWFHDWTIVPIDREGLTFVRPDLVSVVFRDSGSSIFLDFNGNGEFLAGAEEGQYEFTYTVTPKAGSGDLIDRVSVSRLTANFTLKGTADASVAIADTFPIVGSGGAGEIRTGQFAGVISPPAPDEAFLPMSGPLATLVVDTYIKASGSPGSAISDPPGATVDLQSFRQTVFLIPEPGSLALLAAGAVAGGALRRRRST